MWVKKYTGQADPYSSLVSLHPSGNPTERANTHLYINAGRAGTAGIESELLCPANPASNLNPSFALSNLIFFKSVKLFYCRRSDCRPSLCPFCDANSLTLQRVVFTPLMHMTQRFSALLSIITPPSAHVAFVCASVHLSRSLPHASFFPLCMSSQQNARAPSLSKLSLPLLARQTPTTAARVGVCVLSKEKGSRCPEETVRDGKS